MKAKELIAELMEYDPEAEIILQKDSEGNGYSPLVGSTDGWYVPTCTWAGDFYGACGTAEDNDQTDEEFAEMASKPKAVVLWPVS